MRLSPTVRSRPHAFQPIREGPGDQAAQARARRTGAGPDLPNQADGQLDGERHGGLRHRHALGMLLRDIDIPPGLPQGHPIVAGGHPQDRRGRQASQQGQGPIDALGMLVRRGPPTSAHETLMYNRSRLRLVTFLRGRPRARHHAGPREVRDCV